MAQERTLQELRERRGADQAELDRLSAQLQELEAEHQRLSAPREVDPAELQRLEQREPGARARARPDAREPAGLTPPP